MSRQIISRLQRLDYLIRTKSTGTPTQLADRLSISRRSLYEYLNLLKDLEAPVKYDRKRASYFYEEDGQCNFLFKKKAY